MRYFLMDHSNLFGYTKMAAKEIIVYTEIQCGKSESQGL